MRSGLICKLYDELYDDELYDELYNELYDKLHELYDKLHELYDESYRWAGERSTGEWRKPRVNCAVDTGMSM